MIDCFIRVGGLYELNNNNNNNNNNNMLNLAVCHNLYAQTGCKPEISNLGC